ncbi:MAG: RNA 2'-phosphotransferase [Candidatus Promineifilaceae bacterium]|nr:RNA 2'-phosphotransferase [Candidatus Promineifilaceae bacterium]
MTTLDLIHLSKTISHALRHAPWLYELELDEAGWTPVGDLLEGLRRHRPAWRELDVDDLQAVIDRAGKKRFEMREGKIRALYGHSLQSKIAKEPAVPPFVLYHGTTPAAAQTIQREGLQPMRRQYVHLSADEGTAREVGLRKGPEPVILMIRASEAHAAGVAFYRGNDLIWLADPIPPSFIST